jgi:hypothetical protein
MKLDDAIRLLEKCRVAGGTAEVTDDRGRPLLIANLSYPNGPAEPYRVKLLFSPEPEAKP